MHNRSLSPASLSDRRETPYPLTAYQWDASGEIRAAGVARNGLDDGLGANGIRYIPVVVTDACGFGHRDAAARSIASLEFAGAALLRSKGALLVL